MPEDPGVVHRVSLCPPEAQLTPRTIPEWLSLPAGVGADLAKGPDPVSETTMYRVRLFKAAQQPGWAQLPPWGMLELFPRGVRCLWPPRMVAVLMVSLPLSEQFCHTAFHTVRNKWPAYFPVYKLSQMPLDKHKAYPHSNLLPLHMTKIYIKGKTLKKFNRRIQKGVGISNTSNLLPDLRSTQNNTSSSFSFPRFLVSLL